MSSDPKPDSADAAPFGPSALSWVWLSMLVLVLDQGTKAWASATLVYGVPVPVLPGLNWTLLHNPGAAFSFLGSASGWQRWLFTGIAFGVSALILAWLWRLPRHDWRNALPLALILGGALGNVVDRLRLGYVVDFIDVYYDRWHWPAFNLADSAIVVGALMMVWVSLRAPAADPGQRPD